MRDLLKKYVDERVLFYTTRDQHRLVKIEADTAELRKGLWTAVLPGAGGPADTHTCPGQFPA